MPLVASLRIDSVSLFDCCQHAYTETDFLKN